MGWETKRNLQEKRPAFGRPPSARSGRSCIAACRHRTFAAADRPSMLSSAAWTWIGHGVTQNSVGTTTLTYLEINGWLLSAAGTTILIDPVLEGNLDFGFPDLYDASKRVLPSTGLIETLPPLDALLITQGLDDHAHGRTLRRLAARMPELRVFAPPSARATVGLYFPRSATYLASRSRRLDLPYLGLDALPTVRLPPGKDTDRAQVKGISIDATSGALVGPPWQRRENGYILRMSDGAPSLYIEPHVEFDADELAAKGPVDAVITPTSGQSLPGFELVHGPRASADLVQALQPRWVVPMGNGDVDARGVTSPLISPIGDQEEFARRLANVRGQPPPPKVVDVSPGKPITLRRAPLST